MSSMFTVRSQNFQFWISGGKKREYVGQFGWATGLTVVPITLLERFYPGGVCAFKSGNLRGCPEVVSVEDLLFVPLGPYGSDPLGGTHFVAAKDYLHWCSSTPAAPPWMELSKTNLPKFAFRIFRDRLRPSEHLYQHSTLGRTERIAAAATQVSSLESRADAILRELTLDCGKEVAVRIEKTLAEMVAVHPHVLLKYAADVRCQVREAVAVVAGGYLDRGDVHDPLRHLLETMEQDPDKWVRIKAERALRGTSVTARISPLGNACLSLRLALRTGVNDRSHTDAIGQAFTRKIRRRKRRALEIDQAQMQNLTALMNIMMGAPLSSAEYHIDTTPGWKGDELRIFTIQYFSFDTYRAVYAVWPQRDREVFLVQDNDKDGSLGVWIVKLESKSEAEKIIDSIDPKCLESGVPLERWERLL